MYYNTNRDSVYYRNKKNAVSITQTPYGDLKIIRGAKYSLFTLNGDEVCTKVYLINRGWTEAEIASIPSYIVYNDVRKTSTTYYKLKEVKDYEEKRI